MPFLVSKKRCLTSLQDNGTALPSIAQKLIQQNQDLYADTPLFKKQDLAARDATGIAYAGKAVFAPSRTIIEVLNVAMPCH